MHPQVEEYKGFRIWVRRHTAGYQAAASEMGRLNENLPLFKQIWLADLKTEVVRGRGAKKRALASIKALVDRAAAAKSEIERLCIMYESGTFLTNEQFRKLIRAAGNAVARAVKTGKLKKEPCADCGATENLEAHHESYKREHWLDVTWLCRDCHSRRPSYYYAELTKRRWEESAG